MRLNSLSFLSLAKYFLLAWPILAIGALTPALLSAGWLPAGILSVETLLIGSALELVFLYFLLQAHAKATLREQERAATKAAAEQAASVALSALEADLRQQLRARDVVLDNTLVGIGSLNPNGRLTWSNQGLRQVLGMGNNPLNSIEKFHQSREQYLAVGGRAIASLNRGDNYEDEVQMRRFDGSPIWISMFGKAVNHGDLTQGSVWVWVDVTRRKQLEAQLARTLSEREAILNNAVVGIVLSIDGRHEWINAKFASMLGYSPEALIGKSSRYIHPDQDAWEAFGREARQALIETGSFSSERKIRHQNGTLLWVQMDGSCVVANSPDSGVIWTFLEIGERKRSESLALEALAQQKALNARRTRFVSMTSHEFRTPLAAILSAQGLLRDYADRLPDSEKWELLVIISEGVQRMTCMLDRMLLLGQADAKLLTFEPAMLDLHDLCQRILGEARMLQTDIECALNLDYAASSRQQAGPVRRKAAAHFWQSTVQCDQVLPIGRQRAVQGQRRPCAHGVRGIGYGHWNPRGRTGRLVCIIPPRQQRGRDRRHRLGPVDCEECGGSARWQSQRHQHRGKWNLLYGAPRPSGTQI